MVAGISVLADVSTMNNGVVVVVVVLKKDTNGVRFFERTTYF